VLGLNQYEDSISVFEEKYESQIVNFATIEMVNNGKIYPGFNDGVFPIFFFARYVTCNDLSMRYGFNDV
jgi:hypothetical protein